MSTLNVDLYVCLLNELARQTRLPRLQLARLVNARRMCCRGEA